ncbi:MAG: transketolase [bacterium]|nr:transketolase [bacterium]
MATTTKNNKKNLKELQEIGEEIRRLVIEMSERSKSGETGSSLSISDILAVLYFDTLDIDPKHPNDPSRDRFVLSKGHGAAAYYATLALRGYFPLKKLLGHRVNAGTFHAHPSRSAAPGVEASTGSLGHGLSIAVGMAYALTNTKSKAYVLIGDGECNEGSVWEAVMFAGNHQLKNIVAIIDDNKFQGFGPTMSTNKHDLGTQWKAFGWKVLRADGHNPKDLVKVFREAKRATVPTVVIADTVAGKGIPHIEHTLGAHYYVPNTNDVAVSQKNGKTPRLNGRLRGVISGRSTSLQWTVARRAFGKAKKS